MNNIEIFEQRIDDEHLDSFWYDGLIAESNGYSLYATGEIKGVFDGSTLYGTQLVYLLEDLGYTDKDLEQVDFYDNNWFEIFYPDGESYVPDNQGYDEVLSEFIEIAKEQTNES